MAYEGFDTKALQSLREEAHRGWVAGGLDVQAMDAELGRRAQVAAAEESVLKTGDRLTIIIRLAQALTREERVALAASLG